MSTQYRKPIGLFDDLTLSERDVIRRFELSRALLVRAVSALLIGVSLDFGLAQNLFGPISAWVTVAPAAAVSFVLAVEFALFTYAFTYLTRRQMIVCMRLFQSVCVTVIVGVIVLLIAVSEFMIDLGKFLSPKLLAALFLAAIFLWLFEQLAIEDAQRAAARRVRRRARHE